MSHSYEITHASSNTTESVTLSVADKTGMVLANIDADPKSGRITSTYILASGDVAHPATVQYSVDPVKGDGKTRYGSVTFRTWATDTDSISGAIVWYPVQATVSFVIPDGAPVQLADFMKLIAVVFSYTYKAVASGARDTAWAQNLLLGGSAMS